MKKQIRKLILNKRTISNLNVAEMNEKLGGHWTARCHGHTYNCTGGGNCDGGGGGNSAHCPTAYGKNTCAPNC